MDSHIDDIIGGGGMTLDDYRHSHIKSLRTVALLLKDGAKMSAAQLSARGNMSESGTRTTIRMLRKEGLIYISGWARANYPNAKLLPVYSAGNEPDVEKPNSPPPSNRPEYIAAYRNSRCPSNSNASTNDTDWHGIFHNFVTCPQGIR